MKNLETKLVERLTESGKKVATAESCTGGLVAMRITSVKGSSACFDLGVVSYANEQKEKVLGVSMEDIKKFGAVSEVVALQMSEGVKKLSGSDFGIGITGLAGPGGGTDKKPVGLVYISICSENEHKAFEYHFKGNREEVRRKTSDEALKLVLERV